MTPDAIILEPVARNTAAAVAVAALAAVKKSADAIIAVMPSDHVVKDAQAFAASLKRAAAIAATGKLVLFGIVPSGPHTGYGYIRRGEALPGEGGGFGVDAFFEKPNRATAEKYVADANYFWNSGIFVLHARTFLAEIEQLAPDVLAAARAAFDAAGEDLGFLRLDSACLRALAQHLRRLRGDGEDEESGDGAHRRRLERRRLVVVAVGGLAAR